MDFLFGGARETIFGKVVGESSTVEVAGILVMSTFVGILEGPGILVMFAGVSILEGAGILVMSTLVGITEGPGILDGPSREYLIAVFSWGSSSISSSGRYGIDEGPADGAVERMSLEGSWLDVIFDLFYGRSENC